MRTATILCVYESEGYKKPKKRTTEKHKEQISKKDVEQSRWRAGAGVRWECIRRGPILPHGGRNSLFENSTATFVVMVLLILNKKKKERVKRNRHWGFEFGL
jgi:hypothetical protein